MAHGSTGAFSLDVLSLDSESHDPGLPSHCQCSAYRRIVPSSRAAWCSACAPGRSQPCYSSQSPFVGRSVGRRPEARAHGGKATRPDLRPHPLRVRHASRRISLAGGTFEAGLAEMRENCPRQPPPRGCRVTPTNLDELQLLRAANRDQLELKGVHVFTVRRPLPQWW